MYNFVRQTIGGFYVHKATPEVGAIHLKKFAYKVTPQNQATLNVYIAGSFELTFSFFTQLLEAGQTSLDIALSEYPAGELITERVVAGPTLRYCVAKVGGRAWHREKLRLGGETAFTESSMLVVLEGQIDGHHAGDCFVVDEHKVVIGDATVIRCWV